MFDGWLFRGGWVGPRKSTTRPQEQPRGILTLHIVHSAGNREQIARESAIPEYIVRKSRAGAWVLTKLRGSLKRERRS